ncbi:pyridoxamine 5'-phosphate oxidase family protein [Nocardia asteroides]
MRPTEVLDAPVFATVATIQPDGSPHQSVVWVLRRGRDPVRGGSGQSQGAQSASGRARQRAAQPHLSGPTPTPRSTAPPSCPTKAVPNCAIVWR